MPHYAANKVVSRLAGNGSSPVPVKQNLAETKGATTAGIGSMGNSTPAQTDCVPLILLAWACWARLFVVLSRVTSAPETVSGESLKTLQFHSFFTDRATRIAEVIVLFNR